MDFSGGCNGGSSGEGSTTGQFIDKGIRFVATFHAIAATGKAILRVLEDACPRDVFPQARFDFLPLDENTKPVSEGITVHLYRVASNTSRRYKTLPPTPEGKRTRPMLNLDLYFLITPWASNADTLQRLLGWAMRALEDAPILPPGLLNSFGPETETFHSDEAVELLFDPLSLQDMSIIWDQIRPKVGVSVTYVARMVPIESRIVIIEAEPVQTRVFELQKKGLP